MPRSNSTNPAMIAFGLGSGMDRFVTRRVVIPPSNNKEASTGRSDLTERYFIITVSLLPLTFVSTVLAITTSPLFIITAVVAALVFLLACIQFKCESMSRERQKKHRQQHARQHLPRQVRRTATELVESRSLSEPSLESRSPASQERSTSGIGNVVLVVLPPLQLTPTLQEAGAEVSSSDIHQSPPDYDTAMSQIRPETPPPLYSTLKNLPDYV